jgi:hypothetical protein
MAASRFLLWSSVGYVVSHHLLLGSSAMFTISDNQGNSCTQRMSNQGDLDVFPPLKRLGLY